MIILRFDVEAAVRPVVARVEDPGLIGASVDEEGLAVPKSNGEKSIDLVEDGKLLLDDPVGAVRVQLGLLGRPGVGHAAEVQPGRVGLAGRDACHPREYSRNVLVQNVLSVSVGWDSVSRPGSQ